MGRGGGGLEAPLLSCEGLLVAIRADKQNPPERCGAGWICRLHVHNKSVWGGLLWSVVVLQPPMMLSHLHTQ